MQNDQDAPLFRRLCGFFAERQWALIGAAWLFFGVRVAHSAIHCTVNVVIVRFWIYAAASAALWFMIFRAALNVMTG